MREIAESAGKKRLRKKILECLENRLGKEKEEKTVEAPEPTPTEALLTEIRDMLKERQDPKAG